MSDPLQEAIEQFTAPGQPYAMETALIDGVQFRVFSNAPRNLRALYAAGAAHGDRTFFVYEDERLSFAETFARSAQLANAIARRGIGKGDRVAIAMRNYPEWPLSFMGATALGVVAVAMNAWWTSEEMLYGLEDSGARLLIVDGERLTRLLPVLDRVRAQVVVTRHSGPLPAGVVSWAQFIDGVPADATTMPTIDIAPDDNATLLYTSGSTAHPKGALSSHRGVLHAVLGWESGAALAAHLFPETVDDDPSEVPAMILCVPLFHVTGLNVHFMSSFRPGRKLVSMYKWDPEQALQIIERERITSFNGVPTMSWEIVQSPNFHKYDLSSLKAMGGGGAAMAPEHSRQIAAKVRANVPGTGYGMTETNGLGSSIAGQALLERPRSCGRAIVPVVTIRIVDAAGTELPRGQTGEIWIHGAMNFRGYWNQPEATAETLSDGWVHSGDLGHMDDEGYVFITDRAKDMVIRGGENIGCQEVEAVIQDHPAVSEVAVFGLPDERLGEIVAAVVMVKPGMSLAQDDVQRHVGARLARFKVPERVWVQQEQLPRIASGKIYKRGLRDSALASLASDAT